MKLTGKTRIWVVLCIAMMLGTYFVPIWSITLYAPQYPEGLGMEIWINKIIGVGSFDLQNINLLNHYIGMPPIDPHGIPEFDYAPYILIALAILACIIVLSGNLLILYVELILLGILGCIGLLDFLRWEYNFGHNLSPEAPIKIPGMNYQPPFLGCKHILNITACSFPDTGAYLLFAIGIILFGIILWRRLKFKTFFILCLMFIGCSRNDPGKWTPGEYGCNQCQMNIVDMRFKSAAITTKGKIIPFDSIECLLEWKKNNPQKDLKNLFVTDFNNPDRWIILSHAHLLKSNKRPSPMNGFLSAYSSQENLEKAQKIVGGIRFEFPQE